MCATRLSCDALLCEAIVATLDTLAAGNITSKELPIDPKTRDGFIKYAPGFSSLPPAEHMPKHPYTVEGLAKFLGEVKDGTDSATESFRATFGALELIDGNGLKEGDVANLEVWKIDAVVSESRAQYASQVGATEESFRPVSDSCNKSPLLG